MATILNGLTDFTDPTIRSSVTETDPEWLIGGDNIYLVRGDQYYGQLLRDRGIDPADPLLVTPPIFTVKEVMRYWVSIQVCIDIINDSQAPFEGQIIMEDKWNRKLAEYEKKWTLALNDLDDNAFFDEDKSTESSAVSRFGRF